MHERGKRAEASRSCDQKPVGPDAELEKKTNLPTAKASSKPRLAG